MGEDDRAPGRLHYSRKANEDSRYENQSQLSSLLANSIEQNLSSGFRPNPLQTHYFKTQKKNNRECMFCKNKKPDAIEKRRQKERMKRKKDIMLMDSSCGSDAENRDFASRHQVIRYNLERKYLTSRDYYNVKIVNDIIYNENTHVVSVFKDYLIYDDVSEFLKRFYMCGESTSRLPRIIDFYEKYSKVFPNYVVLPESRYMFRNIEKKQAYFDSKHQQLQRIEERQERLGGRRGLTSSSVESAEDRLFSTTFEYSVAHMQPNPPIDFTLRDLYRSYREESSCL